MMTIQPAAGPFYHGTRADLKPGDLIGLGYASNYGAGKKATYVYLTATLDAATWGAELAAGEDPGSKHDKAVALSIPVLDEAGLLELVKARR